MEKLQQISELMGVSMEDLVNSDDKTVFNFAENCNQNHYFQSPLANCTIFLTEAQCAHELAKAHLIIEQKTKEIELLNKQIVQLQEINALLKRQ